MNRMDDFNRREFPEQRRRRETSSNRRRPDRDRGGEYSRDRYAGRDNDFSTMPISNIDVENGRKRSKVRDGNGGGNKPPKGRKNNKKTKKGMGKKIFLGGILFLIALIVIVAIWGFSFLNGLKSDDLMEGIKPGKDDPINILVLGMDIGDTNDLSNKSARRTDSIMVVNYHPKTDKAHVVTIPRDTKVLYDDGYDRINAAYTIGQEEEVLYQVEHLLDIQVNYIVEIDYDAFRNFIDAIGGIEMTIDKDMYYDDDAQNLHIHFNKGETVQMNGEEAEGYYRWRKNNDGTGLALGDIDRIKHQQKLISKITEKCLSPSIIGKIPAILDVVKKDVITNLDASTMLKYGLKIAKAGTENIVMTSLNGEFEGALWNVDNADNSEIINALNGAGEIVPSSKKEGLKILVLNGAGVPGLAGEVENSLITAGYDDTESDNYPDGAYESVIQCSDEVKAILSGDISITNFTTKKDPVYSSYDAVIIIGEDYSW